MNYLPITAVLLFGLHTEAADVLRGNHISFTCSISDLPVVWTLTSDTSNYYRTLAYLDGNGHFYVGVASKHKLER